MLFKRRGKVGSNVYNGPTALEQDFMNDFGPEFAEKLNQYNHEHENYPFIFYFGKLRISEKDPYVELFKNGGIRAIPEDVPEDIRNELMNDPDHPLKDEYSVQTGYLKDLYYDEYYDKKDDPDVYAKLVPVFFRMEIDDYAEKHNIRARFQEDPLHRVPGGSAYRHYQDPPGLRRDIFGQEIARATRGDAELDAKPDA